MFEMGGCLPLESIQTQNDPLQKYPKLELNSGRACFYEAVVRGRAETVYIPFYLCPTVKAFFLEQGIHVIEYNIDEHFFPQNIHLCEKTMIVWTNYYGCMSDEVIDALAKQYGEQLIIDNTQAFFCRPRARAWNVYSCRKFFGVPEGAYLVHEDLKQNTWSAEAKGWEYLQKASLQTSNFAYAEYLENDNRFCYQKGEMSLLTRQYLNAVDYERVKEKRAANFNYLHQLLEEQNELKSGIINFCSRTALMYPFLKKGNADLRRYLLERHIFTPTWWKCVLTSVQTTRFEKYIAQNLIPLPIDQRYSLKDMEYLARNILEKR